MRKLTSDQADAILSAARPLPPADQEPFLEEVSAALAELGDLGDGIVHRIVRDVQRKYLKPPDPTRSARGSYW